MRTRTITAVAATLLLATLTACGSTTEAAAPATATATAENELTSEQKASIAADLGYPADPSAAQRAALMADLDAIDPDITQGKEDKAVSRARDTCRSLKDYPDDPTKQAAMAAKRWTSPTHPEGRTATTAAKIMDAVHKNICPDF
ncbi:hypothetical protein [Streptomyces scopuliridis]|uniref:hypothetical protein n=1 Tax=Streptomyces scopuliridis TaxID=452529 RepID=UPI0036B29BA7